MAESIIVHLRVDDPVDVIRCVETLFVRASEREWRYPIPDYLVIVTRYKDFEVEYEPETQEEIASLLGGHPNLSLDFEIRRSKSDEACDVLEPFIRSKLARFNFVIDDMRRLIVRSDLNDVHDFLDMYRYKKGRREQSTSVSEGNGTPNQAL